MSGLREFQVGPVESQGAFTINGEAALRRLSAVRFPGPHHYLLKFVQAAVAGGAAEICFRLTWWAVEVAWEPPSEVRLEGLLGQLLSSEEPAGHHLAVGAWAALGAGASRVVVEQAGQRLVLGSEGHWSEPGVEGPALRVKILRWRLDLGAELRCLVEHCAWSPIPVRLSGADVRSTQWGDERTLRQVYLAGVGLSAPAVSRARRPPRVARELAGRRIPCWLMLGLEPGDGGGELQLVRHGVLLERFPYDFGQPGVVAVLAVDEVPTDLSGFGVRDGLEWEGRIARLHDELHHVGFPTDET